MMHICNIIKFPNDHTRDIPKKTTVVVVVVADVIIAIVIPLL
jgi:hypothetical protein